MRETKRLLTTKKNAKNLSTKYILYQSKWRAKTTKL